MSERGDDKMTSHAYHARIYSGWEYGIGVLTTGEKNVRVRASRIGTDGILMRNRTRP